jgi:hypothetical protein
LLNFEKKRNETTTHMAWNLLETLKEVHLQSSTSLEFLSNGADSGEKNAMQQINREEGKN